MGDYQPDSGPQALIEVNLRAELRRIMDGEDPLPPGEAIGRIVWLGGGSIPMEGLKPDSRTRLQMPSPVVDDERLAEATVEVHVGYNALVLIASDEPFPKQSLRRLAERSAKELIETAGFGNVSGTSADGFADAINVADGIRYAAVMGDTSSDELDLGRNDSDVVSRTARRSRMSPRR